MHNCTATVRTLSIIVVRLETHTPVDGAKASADDVGVGVHVVVGWVSARSVRIVSVATICKLSGVVYQLVWMRLYYVLSMVEFLHGVNKIVIRICYIKRYGI